MNKVTKCFLRTFVNMRKWSKYFMYVLDTDY
jgi:hypothetical protein